MRRTTKSPCRGRKQGTATTEAVIMLPFFIMFWAIYVYLGQAYDSVIDLGNRTRRDGLHHIVNNCDQNLRPATGTVLSAPAEGSAAGVLEGVRPALSDIGYLQGESPPPQFQQGTYADQVKVEAPHLLGEASVTGLYEATFVCQEGRAAAGDLDLERAATEAWDTHGRDSW